MSHSRRRCRKDFYPPSLGEEAQQETEDEGEDTDEANPQVRIADHKEGDYRGHGDDSGGKCADDPVGCGICPLGVLVDSAVDDGEIASEAVLDVFLLDKFLPGHHGQRGVQVRFVPHVRSQE